MPNIERMAETAIFVQDACNPIAVANAFAEVVQQLKVLGDHDAICSHPVFVLWASKIQSLAKGNFAHAYDWALLAQLGALPA